MKAQKYFNNNKPVNPMVRNRREADRLISSAFRAHMILTLTILHEKYGYGTKRLEKFAEIYEVYLGNYNDGYLTVQGMEDKLFKETWIKVTV